MPTDYSYAVPYSPSSVSSGSGFQVDTIKKLKAAGVEFIRIQIADPTNNIRYRVVPISYFEKLLQSPRPSVAVLKAILGVAFLSLAQGFIPSGEYLILPDLSSLRVLPYKPGHASVMGYLEEKAPVAGPNGPTTTVDVDPRTLLKRVVQNAKETASVEFLVGFEVEFILLTSTSPLATVHNMQAYTNSLAFPTDSVQEKVLEEIARSLIGAGIELLMYHPEAAPGQYELSTGPLPPLQAADALVFTQQTIYNVASKHGLRATLAPRLHAYSCGSATHAHISVHSTTSPPEPSTADPNLNKLEASFLAGLLANLPSLAALTLPFPPSYSRMLDGIFAGGTWVCWGIDNREVPVRLSNATSPSSRNFEFKMLDGTANPYIALAGILGAGLSGITSGAELTIKNCEGPSPAFRDEAGRAALGVSGRLPQNWADARKLLKESSVLTSILGQEFVEKYLSVNELMGNALEAPKDENEKMTLLVENY